MMNRIHVFRIAEPGGRIAAVPVRGDLWLQALKCYRMVCRRLLGFFQHGEFHPPGKE
jgi:hypothetical protein